MDGRASPAVEEAFDKNPRTGPRSPRGLIGRPARAATATARCLARSPRRARLTARRRRSSPQLGRRRGQSLAELQVENGRPVCKEVDPTPLAFLMSRARSKLDRGCAAAAGRSCGAHGAAVQEARFASEKRLVPAEGFWCRPASLMDLPRLGRARRGDACALSTEAVEEGARWRHERTSSRTR